MAKILIVDDEKSIRRTLGEFLQGEGYEVVEAEDADTARQRLQETAFDVVVTDIVLPRVTGVELLRHIHAIAPQVQVVMMTGEPTIETATEALRMGASDYLIKPITKAAILRVVANAVRLKTLEETQRRLEAENRAHQANLERLVEERTAGLTAANKSLDASRRVAFTLLERTAAAKEHAEQAAAKLQREVTERQQATEALRASEERYRTLFDRANEGICLLSANGDLVSVNESYARMHGYRVEEMLPRNLQALNTPETAALVPAQLRRLLAGESLTFEVEHYHKDGHVFPLQVSASLISVGGENFLQCFHHDITERQQAAALGAKSAARHRAILQTAMDGFWLTDLEGRFLEVNDTYCQMSGYSTPELLAMRIPDLEATEAAADTAAHFQKVMAQGEDRFQSQHRRKDGSVFEVEISVQYQPADGGRFVVFVRDITERQRAEESLRLDNQIMANMADGVYLIRERDGVIVYTNDRFEKMFGYAPGELLGQPVSVVNAPTTHPPEAVAQAIMAELGRSGTWEGEVHNVKKDGTTFWCQARVTTFVHSRYGPVWVALHHDITVRKLAVEELRVHQVELQMQNEELRRSQVELDAQRARYFDLFDLAPVGYVTVSKPGLILEANVTVAGLLGVVRGALLRQLFSRFILQEDTDSYYLLRKQLFATGAPQTCELRMVNRAGTSFWVHLSATAAPDAAGAPMCRVTLSDITTHKQAQAALRESEERFRLSMEATSDGLWDWNIKTDAGYFSPAYYRMLGYESGEFPMQGEAWQALMHPDDRERSLKVNQDCIEGQCEHFEVEFRLQAKSGEWRWILGRGRCVERDGRGRALRLVGTHMDITERKQAEVALRESETRFRLLAENIQDVFWLCTAAFDRMLYVSPAFEDVWGRTRASLYQQPRSFADAIHPEDQGRLFAAMQDHAQGNWEVEYRITRPDGSLRWILDRGFPVRDESGAVTLICGVAKDITERKQADAALLASEARLRLAVRSANIGLWDWDRVADTVYFSPEWKGQIGYQDDELPNRFDEWQRRLHPDDLAHTLQTLQAYLAQPEGRYEDEFRLRHKDGSYRWINSHADVRRDAGGQPVRMLGAHLDITERKQAEEALRDANWRMASIIEGTHVGTWEWNIQTGETVFNPLWAETIGYTLAELAPISIKTWGAHVHPEDGSRSAQLLERHFAGELPYYDCECRMKHKDGHWVWVRDRGCVITRTSDGQPLMMFGTHADITRRKQAEEARHREQALSKAIIDSIPGAFYVLDETGRYARWNAYQRDEIVGQPEDRVAGMDAAATVHPDDRALVQSRIGNVLAHGLDETVEGRVLLRGGPAYRWLLMTGRQMMIEGRPFLVGIGIDLTERKQAEAALRESEATFRALADTLPLAIYLSVGLEQTSEYVSPAMVKMFGYTQAEIPSVAQWWPLAYPDTSYRQQIAEEWTRRVKHSLATHTPIEPMETVVTCQDGSKRNIQWGYITLGDKNYAFGLDLTERRRIETALRERFKELTCLYSISSVLASPGIALDEMLDRATRLIPPGWQFPEVTVGRVVLGGLAFQTPNFRETPWRLAGEVLVNGLLVGQVEVCYLEELPASDEGPFLAEERALLNAIAKQVGQAIERKQAEVALRASEAHFRAVTDSATDAIISADSKGNIVGWNGGAERIFGYTEAEVSGQPLTLLIPSRYQDGHLAGLARMQAKGERHVIGKTVEVAGCHKGGHEFPLELSLGEWQVAEGWFYTAIIRDISARKQAEEERKTMEVQLRQALKLESIGQLAAGIAHEINTPTQYIGDNTRFLQDAFKDISQALDHYDRLLQAARQQRVTPELVAATAAAAEAADIAYLTQEVPKSIEQTLQGVARVAKIVRAMKDFSHPGSEAKVSTDLNRAIESTITVAHNEWKYVADLDLALDPQLPSVPCLPGEINQVILNLIINAAHAIGDVVGDGASGKGRIRVSTSQQGDWAEIRVQDSGTGIPEAARGRIFDPFFTTKAVGKGTGQGLTIAHSVVVKQHGGTIEFETELGKGTTFIVRLPLHSGPVTPEKNL